MCADFDGEGTAGGAAKTFGVDQAWEGYKAARDTRLAQSHEGTNQINRFALFEGQLDVELCSDE